MEGNHQDIVKEFKAIQKERDNYHKQYWDEVKKNAEYRRVIRDEKDKEIETLEETLEDGFDVEGEFLKWEETHLKPLKEETFQMLETKAEEIELLKKQHSEEITKIKEEEFSKGYDEGNNPIDQEFLDEKDDEIKKLKARLLCSDGYVVECEKLKQENHDLETYVEEGWLNHKELKLEIVKLKDELQKSKNHRDHRRFNKLTKDHLKLLSENDGRKEIMKIGAERVQELQDEKKQLKERLDDAEEYLQEQVGVVWNEEKEWYQTEGDELTC